MGRAKGNLNPATHKKCAFAGLTQERWTTLANAVGTGKAPEVSLRGFSSSRSWHNEGKRVSTIEGEGTLEVPGALHNHEREVQCAIPSFA